MYVEMIHFIKNTNINEFRDILYKCFSLDIDCLIMKNKICKIDYNLKATIEFGYRIRILDTYKNIHSSLFINDF